MQWRLQVNRLQELIDQLECKVSSRVASALMGRTFLKASHMPRAWSTLCLSQAPRLEPLHEEQLSKGPDSVSPGQGQITGCQVRSWCS